MSASNALVKRHTFLNLAFKIKHELNQMKEMEIQLNETHNITNKIVPKLDYTVLILFGSTN